MSRAIRAHFDGERIRLDEPVALQPNTRLIVTVVDEEDEEREDLYRLSLTGLNCAYGDDEPCYSEVGASTWQPLFRSLEMFPNDFMQDREQSAG